MDIKLVIQTLIMVAFSLLILFAIDITAGIGMVNSLLRMSIATSVLLLVARLMDKRSGISFKNWWNHADKSAKGLYFTGRILAISLIICACMA